MVKQLNNVACKLHLTPTSHLLNGSSYMDIKATRVGHV